MVDEWQVCAKLGAAAVIYLKYYSKLRALLSTGAYLWSIKERQLTGHQVDGIESRTSRRRGKPASKTTRNKTAAGGRPPRCDWAVTFGILMTAPEWLREERGTAEPWWYSTDLHCVTHQWCRLSTLHCMILALLKHSPRTRPYQLLLPQQKGSRRFYFFLFFFLIFFFLVLSRARRFMSVLH